MSGPVCPVCGGMASRVETRWPKQMRPGDVAEVLDVYYPCKHRAVSLDAPEDAAALTQQEQAEEAHHGG